VVLLAFAESPIQLVPDGTLVLHLGVIVLMVALLNATLLKPINRILEERDRRTRGRLSKAQSILSTVSEKLLEYQQRLREARAEGYARMEQERLTLSREREREVAEVKGEVVRWISEQKNQLELEIAAAKSHLAADARVRAVEIGRQILHRQISGNLPHSPEG
jgi:F-type H+-transporting ATPase subunit b